MTGWTTRIFHPKTHMHTAMYVAIAITVVLKVLYLILSTKVKRFNIGKFVSNTIIALLFCIFTYDTQRKEYDTQVFFNIISFSYFHFMFALLCCAYTIEVILNAFTDASNCNHPFNIEDICGIVFAYVCFYFIHDSYRPKYIFKLEAKAKD